MAKLIGLIEDEIKNQYQKETPEYNPPFAATEPDLIKLIDLYWVDKYREGDTYANGWRKTFYNIVEPPTLVSAKEIDFDTKDIRIVAQEGSSYYPAWLFRRDLNNWFQEQNFGKFLNDLVVLYPKYGSVVVQKGSKGSVHIIPIQNMRWQTKVENMESSNFVTQELWMNPTQLEEKRDYWENIDTAQSEARMSKVKNGMVKVYCRFGEIPTEYRERYGLSKDDNYIVITDGDTKLYSAHYEKISDLYRKIDWDKLPARMLGRGQVEKLFEAQIQMNRVANFKSMGLEWSSKNIFQTRDNNFSKNLLTEVDNGETVYVGDDITRIDLVERNLPAYREEESRLDLLVSRRTFDFDVVRGERSPAGTPLGSSLLQSEKAGNYFDLKREELGLFIKGIITDWVIPEFEKQRSIEHRIMLAEFDENELNKIRDLLAVNTYNKEVVNFVGKNNRIPSLEEAAIIKETSKEKVGKAKDINVPKGYYKNLKYKIDIVITNEQIDVSARLTTLQTALGLWTSNPMITQNPVARAIFAKMLDTAGISPIDIYGNTESPDGNSGGVADMSNLASMRGGSPPRVPTINTPVRGTNSRNV